MVLAAAGAFALHDAARGVQAPSIALMTGWVRLVFDSALYSGVALPAFASDEMQITLRDIANKLAIALVNALKLIVSCEVLEICHFPSPHLPDFLALWLVSVRC